MIHTHRQDVNGIRRWPRRLIVSKSGSGVLLMRVDYLETCNVALDPRLSNILRL